MIVARVVQYGSSDIGKSERHNERKNGSYENLNVDPARISMNVHFKSPGERSYLAVLKEKEEAGEISLRGLKADATLFDEMIIDVNTMYFEERGGYEYATRFFEEAVHFVEKKFGPDNIVSAVMHADELNQASTEECGHPVYHYHLHVTAIPVVDKEILWSKRCRDETLRGTVKEVIHQISHSKKWASNVQEKDDAGNPVFRSNGKPKFVRSYSLLQDELFSHMREAGFTDFERGQRGSTAEHLSSLQFQYKKDLERRVALDNEIRLKSVQYEKANGVHKTISEIDGTGRKKSLTGKCLVDPEELDALKSLAREGITSRGEIGRLNDDIIFFKRRYYSSEEAYMRLEDRYNSLKEKCQPYIDAMKRFPDKVTAFVQEILKIPLKTKEKEPEVPEIKVRKRSSDSRTR